MVGRHVVPFLLLILLGAGFGQAAPWSQLQGGPEHSGQVRLPGGGWDVVRIGTLRDGLQSGSWAGAGVLPVTDGLLTAAGAMASNECLLQVNALDFRVLRSFTIPACRQPTLVGYLADVDVALLCTHGFSDSAGIIAVRVKDGTLAWRFAVNVAAPRPAEQYAGQPYDMPGVTRWNCMSAAVDPVAEEIIVPLYGVHGAASSSANLLASVGFDGQMHWARTIPASALLAAQYPHDMLDVVNGPQPNFAPFSVTLNQDGMLVTGLILCPDGGTTVCASNVDAAGLAGAPRQGHYASWASAWLDRDGKATGMRLAVHPQDSEPGSRAVDSTSRWALGRPEGIYTALGDRLYRIQPTRTQPTQPGSAPEGRPLDMESVGEEGRTWAGPVTSDAGVLLPLDTTISLLDRDLAVQWTWPGLGSSWNVDGILAVGQAEVWATLVRESDASHGGNYGGVRGLEARAVRLDAYTGRMLQMLPLPLTPSISPDWAFNLDDGSTQLTGFHTIASYLTMAPVGPDASAPQAIVVTDEAGRAVLLHPTPADSRAFARPSTLYPDLGAALELKIASLGGATARITWGDGDVEDVDVRLQERTLRHIYAQPGPAQGYVTQLLADGTTTTQSLRINVGGSPPLGPPDGVAALGVDSLYPRSGEPLAVRLEPREPAEAVEAFVDWGDLGFTHTAWPTEETGTPASALGLQHTYRSTQRVVATFTIVLRDGTATSQEVTFDVDGSPPAVDRLNFLQVAFAEKNQNLTFGVLGIAVTLLGAAIGLALRRRQRSRIARELNDLEDIRELARRDAMAAARLIGPFRARLHQRLLKGSLTEDQYDLLSARATGMTQRIRLLALGPIEDRLAEGFRAMLGLVLQDGRIDASEADGLRTSLARQGSLSSKERRLVGDLLDAFAG